MILQFQKSNDISFLSIFGGSQIKSNPTTTVCWEAVHIIPMMRDRWSGYETNSLISQTILLQAVQCKHRCRGWLVRRFMIFAGIFILRPHNPGQKLLPNDRFDCETRWGRLGYLTTICCKNLNWKNARAKPITFPLTQSKTGVTGSQQASQI